MRKGTLIVLVLCLFLGCGTVKRGTIPWEEAPQKSEQESPPKSDKKKSTPGNKNTSTSEEDELSDNGKTPNTPVEASEVSLIQEMQQFLQLAYKDWKGTPYLLGGSGYDGIDCSAFMQVIFEDYFSMQIPRTTRKQLQAGKEIKKSNIQTGDLVFFKTGRTTYHVGVMINQSEFLHASTSNGVKISALSYPFWRETYLTTKRIF